MNLDNKVEGLLVFDVLKGSRAEKAGFISGYVSIDPPVVSRGDIIVSVDDVNLSQAGELEEYLKRYHPGGRPIKFKVLREAKLVEIIIY